MISKSHMFCETPEMASMYSETIIFDRAVLSYGIVTLCVLHPKISKLYFFIYYGLTVGQVIKY